MESYIIAGNILYALKIKEQDLKNFLYIHSCFYCHHQMNEHSSIQNTICTEVLEYFLYIVFMKLYFSQVYDSLPTHQEINHEKIENNFLNPHSISTQYISSGTG